MLTEALAVEILIRDRAVLGGLKCGHHEIIVTTQSIVTVFARGKYDIWSSSTILNVNVKSATLIPLF